MGNVIVSMACVRCDVGKLAVFAIWAAALFAIAMAVVFGSILIGHLCDWLDDRRQRLRLGRIDDAIKLLLVDRELREDFQKRLDEAVAKSRENS